MSITADGGGMSLPERTLQCNCHEGSARTCPIHTQEDFDAADRARAAAERVTIPAGALTVEYDVVGRDDAILLVPFPNGGEGGVAVYGSLEDLRGVVDTMSKLLDDLEDS